MTVRVVRYDAGQAAAWNAFVAAAKNGLFLFDRGYMDYHADRLADHSLLILDDDRVVGLLPANERDGRLVSHGGLTFGGVVCDRAMRAETMLAAFDAIRGYLAASGLAGLTYKAVPHIYHKVPAEEDLYALFRADARLVRRDISSTIDLRDRVAFAKGRKWSTGKALKAGLDVAPDPEIQGFMRLEAETLQSRYGVAPTHTPEEMALLAGRFPAHIHLFTARKAGALLGGVIVYESAMVAHAQYIASSPEGRELGAVDAVIDHVLAVYTGVRPYFDFGISTEQAGRYLNAGLIQNKESYGARATVHDVYDLDASGGAS